MPQEIERKFLVDGEYKSKAYASSRIVQGYIVVRAGGPCASAFATTKATSP